MSDVKLLPCPFDGGLARLVVGDGYLNIVCDTCLACMSFNPRKSNEAKAIAAWNTRAHTALLKECLEVVGELDRDLTSFFSNIPAHPHGDAEAAADPLYLRRARALAAKIREAIGG